MNDDSRTYNGFMMKCFSLHSASIGLLMLLILSTPLQSQPLTVYQNPDAVSLQTLWSWRGEGPGDEVGAGAVGLGDLFGTGRNVWSIRRGLGNSLWRIYMSDENGELPSPDRPVWEVAGSPLPPVAGNFFGDSIPWLVCGGSANVPLYWGTRQYLKFPFYRMGTANPPSSPLFWFSPWETWRAEVGQPKQGWTRDIVAGSMAAVDIDDDGDDEFVFMGRPVSEGYYNRIWTYRNRIWIFEGGENFRIDRPTVALKDEEPHDVGQTPRLLIGDFDGDGYRDIVTTAGYGRPGIDYVERIKFWWGTKHLEDMSVEADYVVDLESENSPYTHLGVATIDCDNDGYDDFWFAGPNGRMYLYRMGIEGKVARSRSFTLSDADGVYEITGRPLQLGSMNNRTGGYGMLGVQTTINGSAGFIGLSGGAMGPNGTYDAYYAGELTGLPSGRVHQEYYGGGPVGDIDGDGWTDFLGSNPHWPDGKSRGIAVLLAGGPYIPNDDRTVSVRSVPVAGIASAVHLWPNPVGERLTIAWRGDLPRDPARLRVSDMLGRIVADEGITAAINGSYTWGCDRLAAGSYILHLVDRHGRSVATIPFVKR